MTSDQQKLYKMIDEILWYEWDPIGINNVGARNEYDNYVPQVYNLKITGAEKMDIAKYLDKITTVNMGLESDMEFSERIAEKIIALKYSSDSW